MCFLLASEKSTLQWHVKVSTFLSIYIIVGCIKDFSFFLFAKILRVFFFLMAGILAVLDTCLVVGGVEKANALNSALPPRSDFHFVNLDLLFFCEQHETSKAPFLRNYCLACCVLYSLYMDFALPFSFESKITLSSRSLLMNLACRTCWHE